MRDSERFPVGLVGSSIDLGGLLDICRVIVDANPLEFNRNWLRHSEQMFHRTGRLSVEDLNILTGIVYRDRTRT